MHHLIRLYFSWNFIYFLILASVILTRIIFISSHTFALRPPSPPNAMSNLNSLCRRDCTFLKAYSHLAPPFLSSPLPSPPRTEFSSICRPTPRRGTAPRSPAPTSCTAQTEGEAKHFLSKSFFSFWIRMYVFTLTVTFTLIHIHTYGRVFIGNVEWVCMCVCVTQLTKLTQTLSHVYTYIYRHWYTWVCVYVCSETHPHTQRHSYAQKCAAKKWKNSNAFKRNRENRKCKGGQRGTCGVCKDKRAVKNSCVRLFGAGKVGTE